MRPQSRDIPNHSELASVVFRLLHYDLFHLNRFA